MKNVTLAFEDETLARLRVHAAQNKTTVNALFRKHAEDLLGLQERRKSARERLLELSRLSEAFDEANPNAACDDLPRISREETYAGRRFEWPRHD